MEFSQEDRKPERTEALKTNVTNLFKDYGELAILRGRIIEGPADPSLSPGDDGTVDLDGTRRWPHVIHIEGHKVPSAFQERGIDELEVSYSPSTVLDGEPTKEMVSVYLHEKVGVNKYVYFKRPHNSEEIETEVFQEMTSPPPSTGLTKEQMTEIVEEVSEGGEDMLQWEGAAGEYARAVHGITTDPQMEIDDGDIKMLQQVYPQIKAATEQ